MQPTVSNTKHLITQVLELTSNGIINKDNRPQLSILLKQIKECTSPELFKKVYSTLSFKNDWVLCSADYASLEDRIIALLTQDPAKMQIYTDGYDGHSLRAYGYYGDQMPLISEATKLLRGQDTVTLFIHANGHVQVVDIDTPLPDDLVEARVETVSKARVLIINSIAIVYEELRGRSKSPTFALAYGGTSFTLIRNLGFSDEEALQIENSYHVMYEVSDTHAEFLIAEAAFQGFIELAFGLRLRTPTLKATDMSQRKVPYQAKSEGRTANNAASQSYGLLMNRAINATEARIEASKYVNDILILNTIHDAVYYLARIDAKVIQFLNKTLIEEMEWNELAPIKSDAIPMTAQLDIGKSWDKQVTLENNASIEDINNLLTTLEGAM